MRTSLLIVFLGFGVLFCGDLFAQDLVKDLAKDRANLEAQIGLQLYKEHEDYRAISALQRYRILAGTKKASYLSHLLVGQIYHRNDKGELSRRAFDRATRSAEDTHHRSFAFLLATQEECIALSYYFRCADRLAALAETPIADDVRDLVEYQTMYTDLVLRRDGVTRNRADHLRDPLLKARAIELVSQDVAFEDLSLKSPVAAGFLSAAIPGAGQLYNGKPWDALLAFTINAAFGAATYYSIVELENVPISIVSGVFAFGFYAGNIINAVTDAKRINARTYLQFFDNLKRNHWARVKFDIREDRVVFGYTFDWDVD